MRIILEIYYHGTKIETKTVEAEQIYHRPPVVRLDLSITGNQNQRTAKR